MQYECEALYDEQIRDNIRVNSEEMVVHDDINCTRRRFTTAKTDAVMARETVDMKHWTKRP